MITHGCLGTCYNELPQPELVLSPEDSELNYYLWMPGVQYEPRLQKKLTKLRSIVSERADTEAEPLNVEQVVAEVIEEDELVKRFKELSTEGRMDMGTASNLVRKLGATPSQADLTEYAHTYGENINHDQFKELLALNMYPEEDREFVTKVLCGLALDHNNMAFNQLEYILSNYGEPLTAAEMAAVKEVLYGNKATKPCPELAALIKE